MSGDTGFTFLRRTPEEWLDIESERNSLRRAMRGERSPAPPAVTAPFYARHRSRERDNRPRLVPLTAPERPTVTNVRAAEFQALERCYTHAQDRIAALADMVARLSVENVRLRKELVPVPGANALQEPQPRQEI